METEITSLIISAAIAVLAGIMIIPKLIKHAETLSLHDKPNARKLHRKLIPTAGGISFLPVLLAGFLIFSPQPILVIPITLIALTGIIDDTRGVRALLKLAIQLGVSCMLYFLGVKLQHLHGLMGIYELPEAWSFVLTIGLFTASMNAFNLIDGVDGLAGGLGLINSIIFTLIFAYQGQFDLAIISALFAGSLIGFLIFNYNPAKIFMGDTGSLVLGTLMALFFIEAWSTNLAEGHILSMSILLIPFMDMLRLFIKRPLEGQSPFKADKGHIHHMMLAFDKDHRKVSNYIHIQHLFFLLLAMTFIESFNFTDSVLLQLGSTSIIYGVLEIRRVIRMKNKISSINLQTKEDLKLNHLLKKHLS